MKKATLCVSSPLRSHHKGGHIVDSELTHSSVLNGVFSPSPVFQHHAVPPAIVSPFVNLDNVRGTRVKNTGQTLRNEPTGGSTGAGEFSNSSLQ